MRILPSRLQGFSDSFGADLLAGASGAAVGAPQAMGFAIIAGVSPIFGLYTAVVATIVGALSTSSVFMTVNPTNALVLVVGSTLSAYADDDPLGHLFTLTVMVGLVQLLLGLLRAGNLFRFVSNAVMTGFVSGAGLLIIIGQLHALVGLGSVVRAALSRASATGCSACRRRSRRRFSLASFPSRSFWRLNELA